ncbi:MAG: MotA/TolQ/ExbB proton channel family protein [Candidatus Edwardsbacteria bacterium]
MAIIPGLGQLSVGMKVLIMGVIPLILAIALGIALAYTRKIGILTLLLYILGLVVSTVIFSTLPDFIQKGGPLVIVLILLVILLITYILERILTIKRARGTKPFTVFLKEFRDQLCEGNVTGAISTCNAQGGSCANVLRAGLERYLTIAEEKSPWEKKIAEVQRAVEEANMLETPLLERNLVVLTTIASIGTMVGLLGTTIGMIRAFQAMAHVGAPDAIELARGISEALINTAGGLVNGIGGIVSNNYFMNRVDQFNYQTDEAVYEMTQILTMIGGTK